MGTELRKFVICIFLGGLLYHWFWMLVSRTALSQPLSASVHLGLLYAVPVLLAIVVARLIGAIGGEATSFVRWLIVIALSIAVPLAALQILGAVACVISRECL